MGCEAGELKTARMFGFGEEDEVKAGVGTEVGALSGCVFAGLCWCVVDDACDDDEEEEG